MKINPLIFIRIFSLLVEAVETIEVTTSGRPSEEKKAKAIDFFRSSYDTIDEFAKFDEDMDKFFKEKLAPQAITILVEWFNTFGWNLPTTPKKKG
jgi:hypothetical protein